jgi:hypothetical protein
MTEAPTSAAAAPSLRRQLSGSATAASRLRSLRSPLRGLDPAVALPTDGQLSERRRALGRTGSVIAQQAGCEVAPAPQPPWPILSRWCLAARYEAGGRTYG